MADAPQGTAAVRRRVVNPRLPRYKNPRTLEPTERTDGPANGYCVRVGDSCDGEVPPPRVREGKFWERNFREENF